MNLYTKQTQTHRQTKTYRKKKKPVVTKRESEGQISVGLADTNNHT